MDIVEIARHFMIGGLFLCLTTMVFSLVLDIIKGVSTLLRMLKNKSSTLRGEKC